MSSASSRIVHTLLPIAGILSLAMPALAAGNSTDNSTARIECVTPDGQTGHVSKLPASDAGASALIMDDGTVTCLLEEGQTDFVVELPKARLLDRLMFLNENAQARGELKIAVSNERLQASSANWVEVEGIVPFSHKRLFGVSLVGIETKFVRLSFRVEKSGQIAAFTNSSRENPAREIPAVPSEKPFTVSALHEALSSKFATRHSREEVLLTANDSSVGPLSEAVR